MLPKRLAIEAAVGTTAPPKAARSAGRESPSSSGRSEGTCCWLAEAGGPASAAEAGAECATPTSSCGALAGKPAAPAADARRCEPPAPGLACVGCLPQAVDAAQGPRPYMEDAHAAGVLATPCGGRAAVFAVLDGHGGAAVANQIAGALVPRLQAELDAAAAAAAAAASAPGGVAAAAAARPLVSRALVAAYQALDAQLGPEAHLCGTTAACCVVTGDALFTANAGAQRRARRGAEPPLAVGGGARCRRPHTISGPRRHPPPRPRPRARAQATAACCSRAATAARCR